MAASDGLPLPLARLDPRLIVVDIVLRPEPTPLLALAARSGCTAYGGRIMLEGQVDAVIDFLRMGGPPTSPQ